MPNSIYKLKVEQGSVQRENAVRNVSAVFPPPKLNYEIEDA